MKLFGLNPVYDGYISNLSQRLKSLSGSVAQLSSGQRLQRASDDVAALSIATRLNSQNVALRSARNNSLEASSLLQVGDGGLSGISNAIDRLLSLSVQSASALPDSERAFIDIEFQQLKGEIDRLAKETRFNRIPILAGAIVIPAANPNAGTGVSSAGTVLADSIDGSRLDDTITPNDGNDVVRALAGNDRIRSGVLTVAGLQGSIYLSGSAISSLAQAETIIAANTPNGTFTATSLDYPNGAPNVQTSTIGALLGTDAATLNPPALSATTANQFVLQFEGAIDVAAAGTYSFSVGSDDGFRLQIDGSTVTQFLGIRGFGTSTGSVTLGAGRHDFRLVYFENAGQEGLLATSSLTSGNPLGTNVLSYVSNAADGNDTLDGGDGYDTAVYDGKQSDYTITQLDSQTYRITDNRTGTPNGTDQLINIERIEFSDSTLELVPSSGQFEDTFVKNLEYQISEKSDQKLVYTIVDATLSNLFSAPATLNIRTKDAAQQAFGELQSAQHTITSHRAYIGSLLSQSDSITESITNRITQQSAAHATLADTDIAAASTQYALDLAGANLATIVIAQATKLNEQLVSDFYSGASVNQ